MSTRTDTLFPDTTLFRAKPKLVSLDERDPEILRTYEKLGIPIEEQKVLAGVEGARKVAVDAVFDSVSVATTFRKELAAAGVIFLSISEAVREYPELVKKWLGKVVPQRENYFTTLNSRSEERRDGKERVSTSRNRWWAIN